MVFLTPRFSEVPWWQLRNSDILKIIACCLPFAVEKKNTIFVIFFVNREKTGASEGKKKKIRETETNTFSLLLMVNKNKKEKKLINKKESWWKRKADRTSCVQIGWKRKVRNVGWRFGKSERGEEVNLFNA